MSLWYYLVKGRPKGPVTLEDIKNEIVAQRLGAGDLLYQEQDSKWREASSFAELREYFKHKSMSEGWVLLVRKLDGSGYRQRGPFSEKQIVSLLKNGEVSFTDYVWRKGLKEWYKILALPEFHKAFDIKEKVLPPVPTEPELSTDLSEITKKLPMPSDSEETIPGRLTPTNTDIKKHIIRSKIKNKSPENFVRRVGIVNYYLSLSFVYKTVFLLGVTIAVGALLTMLTYFSTYLDVKNTALKTPEATFIDSNIKKTESKKIVVAQAPRAEEATGVSPKLAAPEEKVSPTYIKYVKTNEGGEDAKLKVKSDASSHYTIYVTFTGYAGQILTSRSVLKKVRLPKSIDNREIELAKMGLPPGKYLVAIESQDVSTQTSIEFATHSDSFRKQLNRHRKMLTYFHNEERQSFIKTVGRIEKEAFKFVQNVENAANLNSWSGFYKSWQKNFSRIKNTNLDKISNRNRDSFVHAEMWYQLKDLRRKVDQDTKSLNRAKANGQKMDVKSIRASALDLTKLKERMLRESLWE